MKGLDLAVKHRFLTVAFATSAVHIFFCCCINVVVNDNVSTTYFSQVSCLFKIILLDHRKCFSQFFYLNRPVLFS